jgi:hypothetical protein
MFHAFAFKIILLFIVKFKAHGKVQVYGDSHIIYMFDKLFVGVKSNHVVMEQDFQYCTILSCCHVPLVMHAYRCEMSGVIMLKI